MRLYRADKRDFNVGDIVMPAGKFLLKNPEGSLAIEKVLEEERPKDKPPRADCLFLFESPDDARKHWSKMSDGKLYEVTVEPSDVLHRADMSVVDTAFANRSEPETVRDCAKRYWSGQFSKKPVIEVLVHRFINSLTY